MSFLIVRIISSQLRLSGDLRLGDREAPEQEDPSKSPIMEANTLKGGDE